MKDLQNKEKYIIWHIDGGLGKNIASTALISDLKQKYFDRKLIIVASHPQIFLNNPYIHKVYNLGNSPYFYPTYIKNKDTIIFRQEPYFEEGHIKQEQHIIKSWCDILGLKFNNQQPFIAINYPQSKYTDMWVREKPIMLLHTGGGPVDYQGTSYSWTRDMPPELANEIVNNFINDYYIIQVTRPSGYQLNGVERIDNPLNNFQLISLVVASQKRILIDSCLQHAAAVFNKPSTVLWVGTSPKQFGYNIHKNIIANKPKHASQLVNSYLFDYNFQDNDFECPYSSPDEMFDIGHILNSI